MSQLNRRHIAAVFALSPLMAHASTSSSLNLVVSQEQGSALDKLTKTMAKELGEKVSIHYRAGGNGLEAARAMQSSNAWLFAHDSLFTSPLNPLKDQARALGKPQLQVVSALGSAPSVLVVDKAFAAQNLNDFVALAKTNVVNYVSDGLGSTSHLAMEYFASVAGLMLTHYAKESALNLPSARFMELGDAIDAIQKGDVRALAIASNERVSAASAIPTFGELGFQGFEVSSNYFVYAPQNTPSHSVQAMADKIESVLASKKINASLQSMGILNASLEGQKTTAWMNNEIDKWQKIIFDRNIG